MHEADEVKRYIYCLCTADPWLLFSSMHRDGTVAVVGDSRCSRLPGRVPSVSPFLLLPKESWKVCEALLPFLKCSHKSPHLLVRWGSRPCSAPLRHVLRRSPAVYPGGLGIYQDRTPLYINCTEVTHIYTNGSYQLVYQNCTPLFVHTKQVFDYPDLWVQGMSLATEGIAQTKTPHSQIWGLATSVPFFFSPQIRPMGRRGGERRRGGGEGAGIDRQAGLGVRRTREVQSDASDADTAIYLEILWAHRGENTRLIRLHMHSYWL